MPKIAMYAQTCYIWSIYKNDIRIVVQLLPLCPTLWEPMDCSPPGPSIHEISQTRILEWLHTPGDLPDPESEPVSPVLAGEFFITELPGKREIRIILFNIVKCSLAAICNY